MSLMNVLLALKITGIVIALVSVIANSLICHVIVRVKTMKTSINYIILNLGILDAITGVLAIFCIVVNDRGGVLGLNVLEQVYNKSFTLAVSVCVVFDRFYLLGVNTSPLLLTIIAYERYKAIVHPLSRIHGGVSKANLKWMLTLVWLIGLSFTSFDMAMVTYDAVLNTCLDRGYIWYSPKAYFAVFLIMIYFIPSLAMLVFYIRIMSTLRKQSSALGPQAQAERARRKAKKKVMWTIILVTLVFYVGAGIPNISFVIINALDSSAEVVEIFNDVAVVLLTINSSFNPFLYFIAIESFRTGFKHTFRTRRVNRHIGSLRMDTYHGRSIYLAEYASSTGTNEDNKCNSGVSTRL